MAKIADYLIQAQGTALKSASVSEASSGALAVSFQQQLEACRRPVRLSKHAQSRLTERKIQVSPDEWSKIYDKLQEASKMGVRDSVVITKTAALIVNAPNNTVVTAMKLTDAASHIFTNIEGTIIIS
ncbi:MAG: TIGR02530 family flagellar biosynthesis protein [Sporolactobacillus sp.]